MDEDDESEAETIIGPQTILNNQEEEEAEEAEAEEAEAEEAEAEEAEETEEAEAEEEEESSLPAEEEEKQEEEMEEEVPMSGPTAEELEAMLGEEAKVAALPAFISRLIPYKKYLLALAALLLVTLIGSWVSLTDWWEYKSYSMNSAFQLKQLDGEWRRYKFGTVLLVKGVIGNESKVTQNIPKVRVSLFDDDNTPLDVISIVPGRVIPEKMLDNTGEEAMRIMIELQDDVKKIKIKKLWPRKEVEFQAIFIHPQEGATRYQIDFESPDKSGKGSTGAQMYSGKF